MIYRVWCRFEPVENVLTGRPGRWRVVWQQEYLDWMEPVCIGLDVIGVRSRKYHRPGSFINPKRAMGL